MINLASGEIDPCVENVVHEPLQYNLDLVKDCADLAGMFPKNVELKFIYWTHGSATDKISSYDKMNRIAPHVEAADRIAFEIAASEGPDPAKNVPREFRLMNDAIASTYQVKRMSEACRTLKPTSTLAFGLALARCLRDRGVRKVPRMIPIDSFGTTTIEAMQEAKANRVDSPFPERVRLEGVWMRERENIVIRQLHAYAQHLGRDRKPHQIAIIYGSSHSLVSVATRTLGAPTSRVFLDESIITIGDYAERYLRFNEGGKDIAVELNIATQISSRCFDITYLAERLKLEKMHKPAQIDKLLSTTHDLETLCLRAVKRTLTARQQHEFDAHLTTIEPYINGKKRVPLLVRAALRKTTKDLIQLATDARIH